MDVRDFYRNLGFEPYDHQKEAFEKIYSLSEDGGVVVIKAPTASGKTEAAVAPYFAGVYTGEYPFAKLIYVLPTRALANAQKDRLEELARKLGLKLKIVVDHGNVYDKPMLNGDVVVCTLDTFIYGYASLRTFGYRLHYPTSSIATSLVIFDEVQMFQDEEYYTPKIIGRIFKYLYNSRVPFVVMTATLPEKLEKILFEDNRVKVDKENVIVCYRSKRGSVNVGWLDKILLESLNSFVDEIANTKKVGIILNTVPRVQKTYELLKEHLKNEKEIILLHSRMTAQEREKREKMLQELDEFIVVATQVIEAGLDVSLNLMLTELAPADALIQRIGRVARRENEEGNAIIFDVGESFEPYSDKIIKQTRDVVEEIGECLNNLNKTQEIVNRVYENVEIQYNPLLIQAELYFDELRLFALPPEFELRVRPELYATLFVPTRELVDLIKDEAKKNWNEKTDVRRLDLRIKDNSFNVSISWLRSKLDQNKELLLGENNYYCYLEERFVKERSAKVFGIDKIRSIEPYRVYFLNPDYYDKELGLKVIENE